MTLRTKVLLLTSASFLLAVALGAYHQYGLYKRLLSSEKEDFCKESEEKFHQLVELYKKVANSISSYIAKDKEVAELLKADKRQTLYRKLKPLYEEVSREKLIREMVIFKLPANVYLNVRRPEVRDRYAGRTRPDVFEAGKTCISTTSFIICINYVGIRVVNPIMDGEKTLGVVSVGVDMEDFLKHYTRITGIKSGLAVKEEALKKSLIKPSYEKYLKRSFKKDEYLISLVSHKDKYVLEALKGESTTNYMVCQVPIETFSKEKIGFFFTYRDISSLSAALAVDSMRNLFVSYIPLLISIFGMMAIFLEGVNQKVRRLLDIARLVSKRRFQELKEEKVSLDRDEFGLIEEALLDTAKEIEKYINALSKEIEAYTSKAYTDTLTGMFNRRAYEEFGKPLIERFIILGRNLSVMMIDLDNFKGINDTYGHTAGDEVLKSSAELIKSSLRDSDIVFRYGGEEFLVVLPGTPLEGALRAAEKVRKRVELTKLKTGGEEISLTVSIGVAEITEDDKRAEDVVQRADKALYIAKKTGKNRVSAEI